MAGNEIANWVFANCGANCSRGGWTINHAGDGLIRRQSARWNLQQGSPDLYLKVCSFYQYG